MKVATTPGAWLTVVLAAFVSAGLPAAAQRSAPAQTGKSGPGSDAHAVSVLAVVSNKHGAPMPNLKREDFQIQADKTPQVIRDFGPARDLPLTVGLLVNASPAQRDALDEERTASTAFFANLLSDPEKYKGFVVQFARDVDLLQDVTGSKDAVRTALRQLETDRASRVEAVDSSSSRPGSSTDPRGGRYPGRGSDGGSGGRANQPKRANNALYDALFLSADEITKKQAGRKVLIVLSDGDDSGSKESLSSAIEAAQRADTVIYAVYFKERRPSDRGLSVGQPDYCDDSYPGSYPGGYPGGYPGSYPGDCAPRLPQTGERPDGRKTLARICTETGGRMFDASKKEPLADIYKEIADDLNAQYRLTFVPDKDASSSGYHHLLVTVGKAGSKDVVVQSRDGYFMGD